jgi:hypothetical protein
LRFDDAAAAEIETVAPRLAGTTFAAKNIRRGAVIVWRAIGWVFVLAGLSVLVRDGIAWFNTRLWAPLALGQLWYELDRPSLNLAQAVTQRYVSAFLWDRVIVHILLCWAFAVLIGLGAAVLLLAGRRRTTRV